MHDDRRGTRPDAAVRAGKTVDVDSGDEQRSRCRSTRRGWSSRIEQSRAEQMRREERRGEGGGSVSQSGDGGQGGSLTTIKQASTRCPFRPPPPRPGVSAPRRLCQSVSHSVTQSLTHSLTHSLPPVRTHPRLHTCTGTHGLGSTINMLSGRSTRNSKRPPLPSVGATFLANAKTLMQPRRLKQKRWRLAKQTVPSRSSLGCRELLRMARRGSRPWLGSDRRS